MGNKLFNPKDISINSRETTVIKLLNELKGEKNFDTRVYATVGSLIESVLYNIPLPSIYLAITKNGYDLIIDHHIIETMDSFINMGAVLYSSEYNLEGKTFNELEPWMQRKITEAPVTVYYVNELGLSDTQNNITRNIIKYSNT